MKTLIIDTSNEYLVVGIAFGKDLITYKQEKVSKKQSELLLVFVKELLDTQKLTLLDIEKVIVTIGPGSYTGVRIGLTLVKTLWTLNKKLIVEPISSLKAYTNIDELNKVVMDAKSNKSYLAIYNKGKVVIKDCVIDNDLINSYDTNKEELKIISDLSMVNIALNMLVHSKEECKDVANLAPRYIKELS